MEAHPHADTPARRPQRRPLRTCLTLLLGLGCLLLAACGGGDGTPTQGAGTTAAQTGTSVGAATPGATPFIAAVALTLPRFADLDTLSFTIAPHAGARAAPVSVTYRRSWFARRGAWDAATGRLVLPVFGLYAGERNTVGLRFAYRDGSSEARQVAIDAPPYAGPAAMYTASSVKVTRSGIAAPGLDYIFLHSRSAAPVVIDSDGNLRWVGSGLVDSEVALFDGSAFVVGSRNSANLYRMELDSTVTDVVVRAPDIVRFHHDMAPGKTGVLAELDERLPGGGERAGSVLAEIGPDGAVLKRWDMGGILRAVMLAGGDDPSGFVREGTDWFHMNSVLYDASDDSLLVSSRENFVAKLDYATGRLLWLLGDPAKAWYRYPSLRALALTVRGGNPPVGQHSLQRLPDGTLLLFNNGAPSENQPAGAPAGTTIPYSAPVIYAIDAAARTATVTWTYEHGRDLYSPYCSSVRPAADVGSVGGAGGAPAYLVGYSMTENLTHTRLLGVDANGSTVFDIDYPESPCLAFFVATPVVFANLTLQ